MVASTLGLRVGVPTARIERTPSAGNATPRPTPDVRFAEGAHADTLTVSVRGYSAHSPGSSEAPPEVVVLIPGPIGSAYSMRHITDALAAEGIPTVVVDPLGMGTSSRPASADYSLTRQALRIGEILDTLHVGRTVVVAQGTSATVALRLAADQPSRVSAVLSIAGGPVDRQGTRGVRLALALAPVLDNALGRALGRRKFRASVREQSASDAWCTDAVMRAYLAPYEQDLRGSLRALGAMNDAVELVPIAERLTAVQAPVRLLVGSKRSANAPTDAQVVLMSQRLVHFRVDTVANAGTMLQEERPDAVVQAIRELLAPRAKH
jgi:pimeloyl-ACP methyl ester carboxylesterase